MKLLSLNIEGDKHLETKIFPLLRSEKFDALCLQEVFTQDIPKILEVSQLTEYVFVPQARITRPNPHQPPRGEWGIALFGEQLSEVRRDYYVGNAETLPEFYLNDEPNSMNRVLLSALVNIHGQTFRLATTHFTWSGKGAVTELQRANFELLKKYLAEFNEVILCGDFNTPRGGEIYDQLAKMYTDNIPQDVQTTIDKNLHKSGEDIHLVVDGLFTSPGYYVKSCRVLSGLSDHMAVIAEIEHLQ
ncbi:MAG TPA: hypothetical protein PKX78_03405 [Candidatus Woesebacteria bacterium]|nr:hypothetical protein [Candidatus Woesebacteria bacterium]